MMPFLRWQARGRDRRGSADALRSADRETPRQKQPEPGASSATCQSARICAGFAPRPANHSMTLRRLGACGGQQHDVFADDIAEHRRGTGRQRAPCRLQHQQPIGQRSGLIHVMRGEHHRQTFSAQSVDQFPNRDARLRIESGRRFIEKDDARLMHHGASDHQTPLESAGERLGFLIRERAQGRTVDQAINARRQIRLPRTDSSARFEPDCRER